MASSTCNHHMKGRRRAAAAVLCTSTNSKPTVHTRGVDNQLNHHKHYTTMQATTGAQTEFSVCPASKTATWLSPPYIPLKTSPSSRDTQTADKSTANRVPKAPTPLTTTRHPSSKLRAQAPSKQPTDSQTRARVNLSSRGRAETGTTWPQLGYKCVV
jgi:hypothetical protein